MKSRFTAGPLNFLQRNPGILPYLFRSKPVNVLGPDILKGIDTDEIVKEGNKELMVGKDELETIIPGFMNRHGNFYTICMGRGCVLLQ
jgi:hypothetical protein